MTTQNTPEPPKQDTNDEKLREAIKTLREKAYLAGGGNVYADDSLSLYEQDVYKELEDYSHQREQEAYKKGYIDGETSDGYHTFNELYHYRMLYNALYVNELVKNNPYAVHKSKRHSDGELAFGGGWFVVTMDLPTGQVTNHYELKDWDKFHCAELDKAPEWDGHTPQEAAERMEATLRKELDGGDHAK